MNLSKRSVLKMGIGFSNIHTHLALPEKVLETQVGGMPGRFAKADWCISSLIMPS